MFRFLQNKDNKENTQDTIIQEKPYLPFSFPKTKLLLISDTHGSYEYNRPDKSLFSDIDVCILMGDVYETELREIRDTCKETGKALFAIPGNHEPKNCIEEIGIDNIHGHIIEVNGINIAGWGGCLKYKNNELLCMMTNEDSINFADNLWLADILISHSNPLKDNKNLCHSGLVGIDKYLSAHNVPLHFFGHLHERSEQRTGNGTKSICIYRIAKVTISNNVKIEYIL